MQLKTDPCKVDHQTLLGSKYSCFLKKLYIRINISVEKFIGYVLPISVKFNFDNFSELSLCLVSMTKETSLESAIV